MARILYSFKSWTYKVELSWSHQRKEGFINFSSLFRLSKSRPGSMLLTQLRHLRMISSFSQTCPRSHQSHKVIRDAALTAFGRHLCYLSEELVGFAVFDPKLRKEEKLWMLRNCKKKVAALIITYYLSDKRISDFVTNKQSNTTNFFRNSSPSPRHF